MPAKSKAQQRFFGMVRAAQKGEMENPSSEILDVADDISVKDAKKRFQRNKKKRTLNQIHLTSSIPLQLLREVHMDYIKDQVNHQVLWLHLLRKRRKLKKK